MSEIWKESTGGELFRHLSSADIAGLVHTARQSVCYAAPGIQTDVAAAMVKTAERLGPGMLAVALDIDGHTMRMGYGDIKAARMLEKAGVKLGESPGLRSAFIIVDGEGWIFTPTALLLEADKGDATARNAIRMPPELAREAMARMSLESKSIVESQADSAEERERIDRAEVEVSTTHVCKGRLAEVENDLEIRPPVPFDVSRQVRVYEAYLGYVEIRWTSMRLDQKVVRIPPHWLKELSPNGEHNRLKTTFTLVDPKFYRDFLRRAHLDPIAEMKEIRRKFIRSLGKKHGTVFLKRQQKELEQRLEALKEEVAAKSEDEKLELQSHLGKSREAIVGYYLPLLHEKRKNELEDDTRAQINMELDDVKFPTAESLLDKRNLDWIFKDMTIGTLEDDGFFASVKAAFPNEPWDKAHEEYLAAGEADRD